MQNSISVLSEACGNLNSPIMFIGEAPGRLGADDTGIPFHGDKAGHNFEDLLEISGLNRSQLFITNSALCNPKDSKGNNSTPTAAEIKNCSTYLNRQIQIINPKIVVTLGASALKATSIIEDHSLTLRESVRTKNNWNGRTLIPLYHPGQRAMIHRSFANQQSDYKFISDTLRSLGLAKRKTYGSSGASSKDLVEYILSKQSDISYFAIHKIAYLVEYEVFKKCGQRYTNAYFIRQKDGPYCTDLHIQKIKNAFSKVRTGNKKGKLYLSSTDNDLFSQDPKLATSRKKADKLARDTVDKLVTLDDEKLKTKAYLTKPMKDLLKKERAEKRGTYNQPIDFGDNK